MGSLINIRHERFALLYARGVEKKEAFRAAGFTGRPTKQNTYNVLARPEVQARIAEISARAAARTEVTVERVLRETASLAFANLETSPLIPASVKRQALRDLGVYLNMSAPDVVANVAVIVQPGGGGQDAMSLERIMMGLIESRREREQRTIEHQPPEIHVVGERKAEDGPRLVEQPPKDKTTTEAYLEWASKPPRPPGSG
jgi:hypothetical protein